MCAAGCCCTTSRLTRSSAPCASSSLCCRRFVLVPMPCIAGLAAVDNNNNNNTRRFRASCTVHTRRTDGHRASQLMHAHLLQKRRGHRNNCTCAHTMYRLQAKLPPRPRVLGVLLHAAQLEYKFKAIASKLLANKEERWVECQTQAADRMHELAEYVVREGGVLFWCCFGAVWC